MQQREGYVLLAIGVLEQPPSKTQVAHQPSLEVPALSCRSGYYKNTLSLTGRLKPSDDSKYSNTSSVLEDF